ncbi:LCP family protein [Actinoplanes sp. NPDC051475]|uniref:LCP family protein n=1 Tax=Actinoplanes sp. NPDC051475 TaxID=3157225 RepID=UPI00344F48B9
MDKNAPPWRRRTPPWTRWCLALGVLLILASGVILAAERVLLTSATGAIWQEQRLGSARRVNDGHPADLEGAKDILLVGLDTRPGWVNTGQLSRSDSIILVHVAADHSSAYLISFPRDSYVAIPAYDNGKLRYHGGHDKINAAFAYGGRGLTGTAPESHGFELLALTIKELTGITPDAGAIIDFSGFTQVLRILGRVCIYVDETVTSIHVGHDAKGNQARPYTTDSAGLNPRPVPGVTPNVYRRVILTVTRWALAHQVWSSKAGGRAGPPAIASR